LIEYYLTKTRKSDYETMQELLLQAEEPAKEEEVESEESLNSDYIKTF